MSPTGRRCVAFLAGYVLVIAVLAAGGVPLAGHGARAEPSAGEGRKPAPAGEPVYAPELQALLDEGRFAELERRLERLLAKAPADPGLRALKADVLLRRGYYKDAVALLQELVEEHPEASYQGLLRGALAASRPELVAEGKLGVPNPADFTLVESKVVAALRSSDPERIAATVDQARSRLSGMLQSPNPGHRAEALALSGALCLVTEDWDAAVARLEASLSQGLEYWPRVVDVNMALAYAHLRANRPERARPYFDRAMEVYAENAGVDFESASGEWEKMLLYRQVYFGEPPDPEQIGAHAALYERMRQEGIFPGSDSFQGQERLSEVSERLRTGNVWVALDLWEANVDPAQAREEDPRSCIFGESFQIRLNVHAEALMSADLHRSAGDLEGARELYLACLHIFPGHELTRARLESLEEARL